MQAPAPETTASDRVPLADVRDLLVHLVGEAIAHRVRRRAGASPAAAAQDFARQTAHDIVQRGQHFLDALKRGAIRCREPAAEHVFRLAQQAAAKRWIDNSFCDDLTSQILGFREFGCHVLLLSQG